MYKNLVNSESILGKFLDIAISNLGLLVEVYRVFSAHCQSKQLILNESIQCSNSCSMQYHN